MDHPPPPGLRVAVLRSRFNELVTQRLLDGAAGALAEHGVGPDQVRTLEVPGAMELPLAAQLLARSGQVDALVCVGAVVRGETSHFDWVCHQVTEGLLEVQLRHELPIGFGVLTCESREQALARSEPSGRNRGRDAALAALEMAGLAAHLAGGESRA